MMVCAVCVALTWHGLRSCVQVCGNAASVNALSLWLSAWKDGGTDAVAEWNGASATSAMLLHGPVRVNFQT